MNCPIQLNLINSSWLWGPSEHCISQWNKNILNSNICPCTMLNSTLFRKKCQIPHLLQLECKESIQISSFYQDRGSLGQNLT